MGTRLLPLFCLLLMGLSAASADAVDGLSPDLDWSFESGHVRPLAFSPDGELLFAVNTPDARVEIFRRERGRLVFADAVRVGLEPIAVAARSNDEIWVVNRLSDSVSVVHLERDPTPRFRSRWERWLWSYLGGGARGRTIRARVTHTLHVGDEPQDVVFAGPGRRFAYVTAAHRGQNTPFPRGDYATPGVGRADVWVFDAEAPGEGLGGEPVTIVNLFGDSPRALAVSPDGRTVYAAVFRSGNRTKVTNVCPGGAEVGPCVLAQGGAEAPGGMPAPNVNVEGAAAPIANMVIRQDPASALWQDELGRDWSAFVPFELPDLDVFEIDASGAQPAVVAAHAGVGTVLFGMAVNPRTGALYVSNTEARNEVRFEGPGVLAATAKPPGEPASVRGHLHEARVTVIDGDGVTPRALNPHIPYGPGPTPPGVKERTLATPTGLAVSRDGRRLYVAALGSNRVGVLSTKRLERGRLRTDARRSIALRGRGPTGLALRDGLLYVMTRIDHGIEVIDLGCRCTVQRIELDDAEPPEVKLGRPFLYDATVSSSNGEASCGSCHVFGHTDGLSWDLGNPDAEVVPNPNTSIGDQPLDDFHPMKGPFLTQTLRGLERHGVMHWRGDRTAGPAVPSPEAELQAFEAFAGAFDGLLGRDEGPLPAAEMRAFAEFGTRIAVPPNPMAKLDGSLREDEARGLDIFMNERRTVGFDEQGRFTLVECNRCHRLDPEQGLFGTSTESIVSVQSKKVPPLRGMWDRIGMFWMPRDDELSDGALTGPQVRGFGFGSSGSVDTLFRFFTSSAFSLDDDEQRDVEAFVMAFPSRLAPAVGQQVTVYADSPPEVAERLLLLANQAATPRPIDRMPDARACDLVASATLDDEERGFVMDRDGLFVADRASEPRLDVFTLLARAAAQSAPVTFTCAPPGAGRRLGIDRDLDGALDRDERDAGTSPSDPADRPAA